MTYLKAIAAHDIGDAMDRMIERAAKKKQFSGSRGTAEQAPRSDNERAK